MGFNPCGIGFDLFVEQMSGPAFRHLAATRIPRTEKEYFVFHRLFIYEGIGVEESTAVS